MLTDKELLQKLTIAVPVYNGHEFISKTLDSCVNQAGQIWIYDNCSDDGTSEICAEYARKFSHIKYVRHEKNIGAFENFKRPLFDCQTEYFQWLGAHDILGKDFSLNLVREAEKDTAISLAFGRIVCIDEKGDVLKRKNKSHYTEKMLDDDPLERMKAYLLNLRDCYIFHGVFRTEQARKAWVDVHCIGFDDAILLKAVAAGKLAYTENSVFFVRDFPVYRKNIDSRKRQSEEHVSKGEKPLATNLNQMIALMIETVTSLPQYADSMSKGFQVLDAIRKRYVDSKQERIARRNRIILATLSFLVFISLLATSYLYSRCH
jgi:protein O-GlcNAc transferase